MVEVASKPLVLITGVSGFIGSRVCLDFLELGTYRVRGTVRDASNAEKVAPLKAALKEHFDQLELVSADLNSAEQLKAAAVGCTYIVHTASPFHFNIKHEDELIRPAVDGTVAIMEACRENKVKRVVITSSCASVCCPAKTDRPDLVTGSYDESCWSNVDRPEGMHGYMKSKTLAEKAAWKYIEDLPADEKFELVTILPTFVMGPTLVPGGTSVGFGISQLDGSKKQQYSTYGFVDVRDVSLMHVKALSDPKAANQRFIAYSERVMGSDLGKALHEEFAKDGYKVATDAAENTDPDAKVNNAKAREVLGIDFIPGIESCKAMCRSVIELGLVKSAQ